MQSFKRNKTQNRGQDNCDSDTRFPSKAGWIQKAYYRQLRGGVDDRICLSIMYLPDI